jgi:nucleotide-binding universal stress UspA family protein
MESNSHVVAIDDTENSEKAFKWACENLPKRDRLILVHGLYSPSVYDWEVEDEATSAAIMERKRHKKYLKGAHATLVEKYKQKCDEANRECVFVGPKYHTTSDLADKICGIAKMEGAKNVVCGSRGLGTLGR